MTSTSSIAKSTTKESTTGTTTIKTTQTTTDSITVTSVSTITTMTSPISSVTSTEKFASLSSSTTNSFPFNTLSNSLPIFIFSQNNTGSQLNNILKNYTGDLTACLANCSNQGTCVISNEQHYICQCNEYRTGISCQSDTRACSSGPCLNNGTCSSTNDDASFQCTCQNEMYYGRQCENKFNFCLNSTICIQNQGFCQMNGTQPMCKCFMDYSGTNCEIMSTSLIVKKAIISTTTIIAIIVMICYVVVIFCFDYTKYCLMGNNKTNKKKKPIIKRFRYNPRKIISTDKP